MNGKPVIWFCLTLLVLGTLVNGCKRYVTEVRPDDPVNPFDGIDYENGVLNEIPIDSSSLIGLHTYIFAPTCAQPGCHDGNFEPDFRTVQSTYNNLVYHSVIKNDEEESFEYRVVPFDTASSWLWERVTTDDEVLGRMPLYDSLSRHEVGKIAEWILVGAPDFLGDIHGLPDFQPHFFGLLAYLNDTSGDRVDTVRVDIFSPMVFPQDTVVDIWFGLFDWELDGTFIPGNNLTYNKIKISLSPYDFDAYPEEPLLLTSPLSPHYGPLAGDPSVLGPYFHHFKINTADFDLNKAYYFRVYVQDNNHTFPTEIPRDDWPAYLIPMFAFMVQ